MTTIKEKDEFVFFRDFVKNFRTQQPHIFEAIFNKISEKGQEFLRDSLRRQRVVVDKNSNTTEARKVLKIKRRGPPGGN